MSSIHYEIPFIFDSGDADPENITSNGSQFKITFDDVGILVPKHAVFCYLTVNQCTVWNNVYNILKGVNDKWYIEYDDGMIVVNTTITVLAGLYNVDTLNSAILRELNNNPSVPSDLFSVVPDTASSRSVLQFNYSGVQIDFTQNDTSREILGFDSRLVPLAPTTSIQYEISDNIAAFNNLSYFTIGSDLVNKGIRVNSSYQQIIAKVPINVSPGSLINYEQQNLVKIPANELISQKRKSITLWLTNDKLERVDTNGETFSVSMSVHYVIEPESREITN